MELKSVMKMTSDGNHRVVPLEQTYYRAKQILERIGITDVRDLTDYSNLNLPVWSVRKLEDIGGCRVVAYGKGLSAIQSQVSAMMEAIEHYSAQQPPRNSRRATYREIQKSTDVIDLDLYIRDNQREFLENVVIDWLSGVELFTGKEIWVPAQAVLLHETFNGYLLPKHSSNGLAAGNTIEEAICHAICELIERDAWTLAWLRMVTIPYIRLIARNMAPNRNNSTNDMNDMVNNIYPNVNIMSLPSDVYQIVEQFNHSGAALSVRNITSDIGVTTFLAVSRDDDSAGGSIYYGTGTHLNSYVAIVRAITECAQSMRVAACDFEQSVTRQDHSAMMDMCQQNIFSFTESNLPQNFCSINTYNNRDLLDDIKCMLYHLESVGLRQVIVINITPPSLGFPVVRVLIPGIEDWSVFRFSAQHCTLGPRGKKYLALM